MDEQPVAEPTQDVPADTPAEPTPTEENVVEPVAEPTPEVTADQQPPVEGSQDVTPAAENLNTVVQEQAGQPVPATAAPSTDAVTVNENLNAAATRLQEAVDFVKNTLSGHAIAETVISDVEAVIETVKNAVV